MDDDGDWEQGLFDLDCEVAPANKPQPEPPVEKHQPTTSGNIRSLEAFGASVKSAGTAHRKGIQDISNKPRQAAVTDGGSSTEPTLVPFVDAFVEQRKEQENGHTHLTATAPSTPKERTIPGPAGLITPEMLAAVSSSKGRFSLGDLGGILMGTPSGGDRKRRRRMSGNSLLGAAAPTTKPEDDPDFRGGAWMNALLDLGLPPYGRPELVPQDSTNPFWTSIKYILEFGHQSKVPLLVVMVKALNNSELDAAATFKDPSGVMPGTVHSRVLEEHAEELSVGSVLILEKVSVYSPSPRSHYLNVTISNICRVIPGSATPPPPSEEVHSGNRIDLDFFQNAISAEAEQRRKVTEERIQARAAEKASAQSLQAMTATKQQFQPPARASAPARTHAPAHAQPTATRNQPMGYQTAPSHRGYSSNQGGTTHDSSKLQGFPTPQPNRPATALVPPRVAPESVVTPGVSSGTVDDCDFDDDLLLGLDEAVWTAPEKAKPATPAPSPVYAVAKQGAGGAVSAGPVAAVPAQPAPREDIDALLEGLDDSAFMD